MLLICCFLLIIIVTEALKFLNLMKRNGAEIFLVFSKFYFIYNFKSVAGPFATFLPPAYEVQGRVMFTVRIRRMTEGNVFRCLSVKHRPG